MTGFANTVGYSTHANTGVEPTTWAVVAEHHPYVFIVGVVVISWLAGKVLGEIVYGVLFRLPNRALRALNIRKHGWPPPHCDADGDPKPALSEKPEP